MHQCDPIYLQLQIYLVTLHWQLQLHHKNWLLKSKVHADLPRINVPWLDQQFFFFYGSHNLISITLEWIYFVHPWRHSHTALYLRFVYTRLFSGVFLNLGFLKRFAYSLDKWLDFDLPQFELIMNGWLNKAFYWYYQRGLIIKNN